MPLLSNIATKHNTLLSKLSSARWFALALPVTLAAGCSSGPVIDYTVTEAEYLAATAPAEPEPSIAAAQPAPEPPIAAALPKPDPITQALATPPAAKPLPQTSVTAAETVANAANESTAFQLPSESEPEIAAAFDKKAFIDSAKFTPSLYATGGLGISRINPDTSAAPGFDVADEVEPAGQIAVGVDLAKRLSVEVHSADFGSAALSPEGRINYHLNGVSALLYAGPNLNRFRRRGFNAYARVGFSQLENTPVGNVPFIEQTSNHGLFGLGAEYNTRFGLGIRADVTAFDGDVQFGQVGLLYRLGRKPRAPLLAATKRDVLPVLPTLPPPNLPQPLPNLPQEPQIGAATAAKTSAHTFVPAGVAPENTPREIWLSPVSEPQLGAAYAAGDSCTSLSGTLNDVNFYPGSSDLTQGSTIALNDVAETLSTCEHRDLVISAHTDNEGPAIQNAELSKQRARTVALFLARRGVSMSRIRAVAYGESQPIESNATHHGRSLNRRVELTVQ